MNAFKFEIKLTLTDLETGQLMAELTKGTYSNKMQLKLHSSITYPLMQQFILLTAGEIFVHQTLERKKAKLTFLTGYAGASLIGTYNY
ncbi:hypothetical protein MMC07_008975 [Pseudocyphellaria aurata]|nr:hypothetical protein [Pseudocyphellaria aurata]